MNDSLDIKRVFLPIIKNFWLVAIAALLGIAYGQKKAKQMLRVHESRSTIKLNDQHTALTKFLQHIEAFSVIGKYTVELEVMRSDRILQKAIERIDIPISFYHFRDDNWRDKYPQQILKIEGSPRFENQKISLEIIDDKRFHCLFPDGSYFESALGERLKLPEGELVISLNPAQSHFWRPGERLAFQFNDMEGLMEDFGNGEDLLIRLQDEKVAIVNFYTWDESPDRAADFANALAEAYLDDFQKTKAKNALDSRLLLDSLMDEALENIVIAESELLSYQTANQIENYAPVLSERLDQLAILIQKEMWLDLDNKGLRRIETAFAQDTSLLDPGLTYDIINSEPYLNGVRRLRSLSLTRNRLNQIYQKNHPELAVLDRQIINLRHRIGLSVQNTLTTNQRKIDRIKRENLRVRKLIDQIPGTEEDWIQLQRNLKAAEARYENLLEKKAEADIATASSETYHTILERALPANTYLKPNPQIRMGVTGLSFGLMCCIGIHLFLVLSAKVRSVSDLEVFSDLPILAEVRHLSPRHDLIGADMINLAMKLQLDTNTTPLLGFFAASYREQNTQFVFNLAKALSCIGHTVMVVDVDVYTSALTRKSGLETSAGIIEMVSEGADYKNFIQSTSIPNVDFLGVGDRGSFIPSKILHHQHLSAQIKEMQKKYDFLILNLPSLKQGQEAWPLLKQCDRCLLPVEKGRTSRSALGVWEELLQLHEVQNAELIYLAPSRSQKHLFSTNIQAV